MTLSKQQIDLISAEVSAQSIHYSDLKDELTDHIASLVEERIAAGTTFTVALNEAIREVNPEKIQRQRLFHALWLPFSTLPQRTPLQLVTVLLGTIVLTIAVYTLFPSHAMANKWMGMIVITAATLPALLALLDRKRHPYRLSYFAGTIFACSTLGNLMNIGRLFVLEAWMNQSPTVTMVFYTTAFTIIALCYLKAIEAYKKVRQYRLH